MANKLNNCFLINAPAGSGKTTQIKSMIYQSIIEHPKDNILCITYTNRAADELSCNIHHPNIFIGTIHSFLDFFMKRYFFHKEILVLYFQFFEKIIQQRISNPEEKENISTSNQKYIEKFGNLNFDEVQKNITNIYYAKSPFSSLYYGGLSHDDLVIFSKHIFDTIPVIKKRISSKYQYVFIDEYQDTSADVLNIFFESIVGSKSKLYLFGDKMQQIYKNYDGSFEDKFDLFDTNTNLTTNYRSVPNIVNLLNKIYNDTDYNQTSSTKINHELSTEPPKVIIGNSVKELVKIREDEPDSLVLFLFNKEKFKEIGAFNLFNSFQKMEKYSYGREFTPNDILTISYDENPDPLIKLLYLITELYSDYKKNQLGLIIQKMRNNTPIISNESFNITTHSKKILLSEKLNEIFVVLASKEKTISNLLEIIRDTSLIDINYLEAIFQDQEYCEALEVPISEILAVTNYLTQPKISTQHGVKGESHNKVVFIAEDSSRNPVVHMYRFFEMWGKLDISFTEIQKHYYSYIKELFKLQDSINTRIYDLNKDLYNENEKIILESASSIFQKFEQDPMFNFLCIDDYKKFFENPGVTNAKKCLKENTVYGILSAYKLFYVGCSRAREKLTILIDQSKLLGDEQLQINKFLSLGFEVSITSNY